MIRAALVLLLGTVFLLAGVAKLRDGGAFRAVLRKLTPAIFPLLAWLIPLLELSLGLLLLSGRAVRITSAIAFGLLVLFTIALRRMHHLHVGGCGCFGEKAEADSIAFGVARNVLLAAAAASVIASPASPWQFRSGDVIGMVTVVVGACCGWTVLPGLVQSLKAKRDLIRTGSS